MRKFILASMAVLALTACGSNSTATPAAPVTKTVTATVTPAPVTKTVTVAKTPKSCLTALAAAERVFGHASEFATTASKFPPLISKAYHAGLIMDNAEAQSVIDSMKSLTGDVKSETSNVSQDRASFDRYAALCRASK